MALTPVTSINHAGSRVLPTQISVGWGGGGGTTD